MNLSNEAHVLFVLKFCILPDGSDPNPLVAWSASALFYPELNAPGTFVSKEAGALLLKSRRNAVAPRTAVRPGRPLWLIKHNLVGEKRYPFPGGGEVGRGGSDEFVAAIGVPNEFGLAELSDGAGDLFFKGINQFHAPKLRGAVGHLRSKLEK